MYCENRTDGTVAVPIVISYKNSSDNKEVAGRSHVGSQHHPVAVQNNRTF